MLKYLNRRKIEFAFATAILILILAGYVAFRSVVAAGQSASMVEHTYEVLSKLDQLSGAVTHIKTASRTYALSGRPRDLITYEIGGAHADEIVDSLAQLTKDNPEQQASLPDLQSAIEGVQQIARKLLAGREAQRDGFVLQLADIEQAETAISRFDTIVSRMKQREYVLLQRRREEASQDQSSTLILLFAGMTMGLLITVCAGIGTIRDTYKRRQAEAQLHVEKELAQVTLNSIGDGVIRVDQSGAVTFLNQAAELMTGWSEGEAAGRPFTSIFSVVDSFSGQRIIDRMEAAIEKGETLRLPDNSVLVRHDGTRIPIEDVVTPIRDREGLVQGAVTVFRDATTNRAILHSANHDTLTGVPNRRLFEDRFRQAAENSTANNSRLAMLFLDLDGFKPINDRYGHSVGDLLLRGVAKRLRSCIRDCDVISRLGGDEFAVLIGNVDEPADATRRAARILERLSTTYTIMDKRLTVGASIGVAVFPDDASDFESLLSCADSAMYRAKAEGKNTYRLYSAEVIEVPARRA